MADNQSFLPEDYLEKRAQRRTNYFSVTLFIIVMVGVVGAFYVTDQQRRDVRNQQQVINTKFEVAARRLDQFEELQGQRQQMIRKAQVTGTLLERVPRSVMLAELINAMPPNLSLLSLKVDTKIIKRTPPPMTALERAKLKKKHAKNSKDTKPKYEAPDTEVDIILTGVAPTDVQVAQFMTALGHNDLFINQHLAFSEEITINDQTMRKFRVDIELTPDANVQHHQPNLVKRKGEPNPMGDTLELDPKVMTVHKNDAQWRTDATVAH